MASNNLLIARINPLQVLKKNEENDLTENNRFKKDIIIDGKVISDTSVGVNHEDGGVLDLGVDNQGAVLKYSHPDYDQRSFRFECGKGGHTIMEINDSGESVFHTNGKVGLIIHSPASKTYNSIRGIYGDAEGWFLGKAPDTTEDAHFYNNKGGGRISLTQTGGIELTPSGSSSLVTAKGKFVATDHLYAQKSVSLVNSQSKQVSIKLADVGTIGNIFTIGDPTGDGTVALEFKNVTSDTRFTVNGNLSSKGINLENVSTSKNTDVETYTGKILPNIKRTSVTQYKDGKLKELSLGFDTTEVSKTLPLAIDSITKADGSIEKQVDIAAIAAYLLAGIKELDAKVDLLHTSSKDAFCIHTLEERVSSLEAQVEALQGIKQEV